jgi:two-component system nitrate/nitrite response regulator NarL
MIKVIIYEDNLDLRESLVQLVNSNQDMQCVGAFGQCNHADKDALEFEPDVVLMDIDLPGLNGIGGLTLIRKVRPETQIIMLTVFDDNDRVFQSICAGANGYLLKKTSNEKIQDAIREVQNEGAPMTARIAKQVLQLFSHHLPSTTSNQEYKLTKREYETLSWLVKGFSYKMIATEMEVSIDTVRAHIKKIYEKLHVHSMNEAVAKAIKQRIV